MCVNRSCIRCTKYCLNGSIKQTFIQHFMPKPHAPNSIRILELQSNLPERLLTMRMHELRRWRKRKSLMPGIVWQRHVVATVSERLLTMRMHELRRWRKRKSLMPGIVWQRHVVATVSDGLLTIQMHELRRRRQRKCLTKSGTVRQQIVVDSTARRNGRVSVTRRRLRSVSVLKDTNAHHSTTLLSTHVAMRIGQSSGNFTGWLWTLQEHKPSTSWVYCLFPAQFFFY